MGTQVNVQNYLLQSISAFKTFPLVPDFSQIGNSALATSLAICKPLDVLWKAVKVFSAPTAVNTALLSGCGGPCLCRSGISKEY